MRLPQGCTRVLSCHRFVGQLLSVRASRHVTRFLLEGLVRPLVDDGINFMGITGRSVVVDSGVFIGTGLHGLIVEHLLGLQSGLVETGLCVKPVLEDVALFVKLLVQISCLE